MTTLRNALRAVTAGLAIAASTAGAQGGGARVDRAEHHEFVIPNFRTESGVTLPQAKVG